MSMIDKLSGIVALGSTIAGASLLPRLLSDVLVVVAFTIMGSVMVAMLIGGGLYGLYIGLAYYGLDAHIAAIVAGGLALLITSAFVYMAVSRARKLCHMPRHFLGRGPEVISSHASSLVEAFMEGFRTGR